MSIARLTEIASMGYNAAFLIDDTDEHTGTWYKLVVTEACVFNKLTRVPAITGDAIGGVTFPVNHVLEGKFTVIDLTSGSLMAYT